MISLSYVHWLLTFYLCTVHANCSMSCNLNEKTTNGITHYMVDIVLPSLKSSRALTRILKTGVQDSHLAKSRSPTGKSRSPTPKNWSPTNLCIPYFFSILAGSDTFE